MMDRWQLDPHEPTPYAAHTVDYSGYGNADSSANGQEEAARHWYNAGCDTRVRSAGDGHDRGKHHAKKTKDDKKGKKKDKKDQKENKGTGAKDGRGK